MLDSDIEPVLSEKDLDALDDKVKGAINLLHSYFDSVAIFTTVTYNDQTIFYTEQRGNSWATKGLIRDFLKRSDIQK